LLYQQGLLVLYYLLELCDEWVRHDHLHDLVLIHLLPRIYGMLLSNLVLLELSYSALNRRLLLVEHFLLLVVVLLVLLVSRVIIGCQLLIVLLLCFVDKGKLSNY